MSWRFQHLLLFVAVVLAPFVVVTFGFIKGGIIRDGAARRFRRRCFCCHDACKTMRPIRRAATHGRLEALLMYDNRWVSMDGARILARYVKEMHSHPSSNNKE